MKSPYLMMQTQLDLGGEQIIGDNFATIIKFNNGDVALYSNVIEIRLYNKELLVKRDNGSSKYHLRRIKEVWYWKK